MKKKYGSLRLYLCLVIAVFLSAKALAESPWGAKYFPNTRLITHEGEQVKFFDDLIKGKIVAVNFIYTSCPDVCPLETAQLTRVQKILGERVGKDVHLYSISIDPEHDTPEVLAEYRSRFGAKWTFLTGDRREIIDLRKRLGLYIDGVDDGPNKNNHNVSMIIGNQVTGRWMKRSPFENPYVLADQLGNWLTGWTAAQKSDYADAPELRPLIRGESLFRTRCSSCHSVSGNEVAGSIGPDLVGVTKQRDTQWLISWLRAPDKMIADKDPVALALLKKYNNVPMPNLRLNRKEITDLLAYLDGLKAVGEPGQSNVASKQTDQLATMNAWIKEAHPKAKINAGYITLMNMSGKPVTIISATSPQFRKVEFHEMIMKDGMTDMSELELVPVLPARKVEFVPGGKHLMLIDPRSAVKAGEAVDVKLNFADGTSQVVTFRIKKM